MKVRKANSRLTHNKGKRKVGHQYYPATYRYQIFIAFITPIFICLLLDFIFNKPRVQYEKIVETKIVYAQESSPSPEPTIKAPIEKTPVSGEDDFIKVVHMLETSSGTNKDPNALHNLCKAQGKSNEYGYGGMRLKVCFDSHEEATKRIKKWYQDHIKEMSNDEIYCYYNLGLKTSNCEYLIKAKKIINK